ncbi:MAG TPA: ABC transporter substrate-binding protein [Candidatus Saccharimonadales bacterium]|nr:ABC transporter substrate-binding protein [Candidatus Saccharimonadales bacterium]
MRLRSRMWLYIASSVFVMASLAILAERIGAQNADLIQAAKKDGEVAVFGTLENDIAAALHKGFEAKYGIKTNYFRGSSTVIIDRVTSEHRTGKMSADAVFATAEPMKFINKEKGLLVRYVSPSAKDYNKQLVDGFFGPNYRSVIIGFLYNKSMIKVEDAPKTYEDIVNPKWKGKITMGNPSLHDTTINWLASLPAVFGSTQKANDWIKRLAALEPLMLDSMVPVGERIASGEIPLGVAYVKYVHLWGLKGAPIDYVKGLPVYLGDGNYIGLTSKAQHPNAAKLYIDYFLGQESSEIMANVGEFVNRRGILPPIAGADQVAGKFVQMISMTADDYSQKKEEYRKIFRRQ